MSAPRKMKQGQHLPLPARVRRIAGRCQVVQVRVATIDHARATTASKLLLKAHGLMLEAAAELDGLPREARPAKKAAKTE